MYISIKNDNETNVRRWAQEDFGGKKGAISAVIDAAVETYAKEKARQKSVDRMVAHMKKGLFDLKGKKAYEKREDLYDRRIFPD